MNMRGWWIGSLVVLSACTQPSRFDAAGETMGTYYRAQAFCEAPVAALQTQIEEELANVNAEMSTYLEQSELSRFNAAPVETWFPVSPALADVVETAQTLAQLSNGAFDVTVGPLVDLWGFGPGESNGVPDAGAREAVLSRVGYQFLEVRRKPPALKKTARVSVDLSAIAKGHGVDRIAGLLMRQGCPSYLVDIGGEVRAGAAKPTGPWRVGIEVPDPESIGGVQRVIGLEQMAVATSGDYRNFIDVGERRYSHTIDPRTGVPVDHGLASVTVLAETTMLADGLATMLNVLGPDAGLRMANEQAIAALFIIRTESGFEEQLSEAFPSRGLLER